MTSFTGAYLRRHFEGAKKEENGGKGERQKGEKMGLKEEKRKINPLLLKLLAVCRAIRSKPDLYQNDQIRNFLNGKKGSDIPPFDQRHLTQPLLSELQKKANPDDVLGV